MWADAHTRTHTYCPALAPQAALTPVQPHVYTRTLLNCPQNGNQLMHTHICTPRTVRHTHMGGYDAAWVPPSQDPKPANPSSQTRGGRALVLNPKP